MRFLTEKGSIPLPVPPQMHNHGNFIVSLSEFVKWLGRRAEELGVEIYPGFGGSELLLEGDGKSGDLRVKGVATNDVGIGKDGLPKVKDERS